MLRMKESKARSNYSSLSLVVAVFFSIVIYVLVNFFNFSFRPIYEYTTSYKYNCATSDARLVYVNDSRALCLDGSRPAYFYRKGFGQGKTKWNIFFEG